MLLLPDKERKAELLEGWSTNCGFIDGQNCGPMDL